MSRRTGWLAAVLLGLALVLTACVPGGEPTPSQGLGVSWGELRVEDSMELQYATQFSVEHMTGGYSLLTIVDTGRFLVVPEDAPVPDGLDGDITVLRQPLDHIYLVATSAMDLFRALDGLDRIRLSGTDASGWYIEEARRAMESGDILYAGKYSAPDYELIYAQRCDLAIQSTMIYHTPEVKEQLERLGVPVLVERSSYESHPLGRLEWIKLYGVLLDREKQAGEFFQEQMGSLADILRQESTGQTVAFFSINTNGSVNVRKSGDYVAKMIELAGGTYVFHDLTDNGNALSTMNMQMETFYAGAKNADILIYNSAIDGGVHTLEELLSKSSLLADFKAVKQGRVWCTEQNLFQSTTGLGNLIVDIQAVLTQSHPEELTYLYPLTGEGVQP